ncbi:CLC_0170 family protein [Tissierella sp. MB52-C2]|uniref:CLC_0170 family protein n=1 Tax=Tissierella sp. MB52-C2 TaxID=3070999 RepID=UPI00280AA9DE|nr:CLC_0170 family protein [Tissierella sp. MB52-C2]WMM24360.1 CLC_0170 family protein [Tissierella sp. MB52-C2]
MYSELLRILRGLNNYTTILMTVIVGVFTLLLDDRKFKQKGYIRELKILKIISYSYIVIGGLMYILLLVM